MCIVFTVDEMMGAGRLLAGHENNVSTISRQATICTKATFPRFHARQRFARKQRFHDSTAGNDLHEKAPGAFRGNRGNRGFRWYRENRWYAWIRDFVGTVGMRGTVLSPESWRRPALSWFAWFLIGYALIYFGPFWALSQGAENHEKYVKHDF